MKALVHLPDPAVLSFVSSERLEVDWPVGIYVPCATCYRNRLPADLHQRPTRSAVVATSTITEATRLEASDVKSLDPWPPTAQTGDTPMAWRYTLAPLRECDPITDLPCPCLEHGPGMHVNTRLCRNVGGRVPLPEVPTGGVVILGGATE